MSYKLKLVKALSYNGIIKATSAEPYVDVDDEAVVKAALDTGYFEFEDEQKESSDTSTEITETEEYSFDELSDMNISELKAFAKEKGVDISGKNKKTEILETISAALGGSYTMIDLQEK